MKESKEEMPRTHRVPAWARWLVVAAWTCFIWSRSLFAGPESSAQSNLVAELLRPAFGALGIHEFSACTFIVRKAAHFLEYLVLGILLACTCDASEEGARPLWPRALLGVSVPCIDETIQLCVPGRSGQLADVMLDCCGVACGMALVRGIRSVRPRCRR